MYLSHGARNGAQGTQEGPSVPEPFGPPGPMGLQVDHSGAQ